MSDEEFISVIIIKMSLVAAVKYFYIDDYWFKLISLTLRSSTGIDFDN